MALRSYFLSFAAGLLVGSIYSFIKVRSPAPPLIALVGLLGILLGEQGVPLIKQLFVKDNAPIDQVSGQVETHASHQEKS